MFCLALWKDGPRRPSEERSRAAALELHRRRRCSRYNRNAQHKRWKREIAVLAEAETEGWLIAASRTGSRASATRTGSPTATAVEAWSGNGLAVGVADLIKVIS